MGQHTILHLSSSALTLSVRLKGPRPLRPRWHTPPETVGRESSGIFFNDHFDGSLLDTSTKSISNSWQCQSGATCGAPLRCVESPSLVAVSLFYKALRQQRKSRNVFGKVHSERYIRQRYIERLDLGAKLWNACSTSTTSSTSNLLECGKGPFGV